MVSISKDAPTHLFMLGRFAVQQHGRDLDMAPACQRLVALLGIRGMSISRERAAGILWPDASREHSASNLRTCLYRLGAAADVLIARTEQTLCIAPAVDVDFRRAVDLGRRLCDRQSTPTESDLDTRPFEFELLPGWDELWVLVEQEAFRQLRFGALESIARHYIASGRTEQAIQACLLVTRAEPLRESAHRLLARAHAADGNPAQALRQLNSYAELLDKEMGTGPSHFMIDLRADILSEVDPQD